MQQYNHARMNYLKSVLNSQTEDEIKNLKILIEVGQQLKKNVSKYESELKKINVPSNHIEKIEPISIEKTPSIEKIAKIQKPKLSSVDVQDASYTIKSVFTQENMVIVEFNTQVSKEYIKFFEQKVKNGAQDIFDIKGRFKDAYPTKLKIDGVKQIVIKQEKYNTLRLLFEDEKDLNTLYMIDENRLIIKVLGLENPTKNPKVTLSTSHKITPIGHNRTIVLDAGHGGKDSGAIGNNKKYEKIAVFKVTKYLESVLKQRGYKVYLTRNNDTFIKVKNRTILANTKNADIFLSIHANAAHKSKVHEAEGIETFFLSPARSERAKRVAALENKEDVESMSGTTKEVFLESLNRPRITASHKLSIDIHRNMLFSTRKLHKDVVDGGVREGPFWVLVGAQMPSVLIEIGYITHPEEGKRLYNSSYQKELALGIANGIDAYFAKNP